MKAEAEQKAIPAVCALRSPAVDSGSGCVYQQGRGKTLAARTWNTKELLAFWSREVNICLFWQSLHHPCSLPTPMMERGKVQTHHSTRALSAKTRAHTFVLHSFVDVSLIVILHFILQRMCSYLFACCSADIHIVARVMVKWWMWNACKCIRYVWEAPSGNISSH